jgi:hypothetical protein
LNKKVLILAAFIVILAISTGMVESSKALAPVLGGSIKFQNKLKADIEIPICLNRGEIPKDENHWLYIPTFPYELASYDDLGFLSGQLIKAGVIDASFCPTGGLWDTGYANPCGLEASRDAVIYMQNVYDDEILDQVDAVGVPPVLIKQLIRYESQFWPGFMGQYHFGLGHVTNIGAYTALQWNPELYENICISTYQHTCDYSFYQAPIEVKNLLSGRLLGNMNAACSGCEYAVDIEKAEKSIDYLAKVLMGYCRQTSQIVENATGVNPNKVMSYATIWKLTVYSYNMGPSCLYNSLTSSYNTVKNDSTKEMDWGLISSFLTSSECVQGKLYVDKITRPYYSFPEP